MAVLQTKATLFGLDLSGLWPATQQAWLAMGHWPVFAWLSPSVPVRVTRPSGQQVLCAASGKPLASTPKALAAARFDAIELPEDLLLRKQLTLPDLPPADWQQALALEASSQAPFAESDLLWAWSKTPQGAEVLITSRPLVQAHLAQLATAGHWPTAAREASAPPPEVWVRSHSGAALVVPGFGEARRQRHQRLWRRVNTALLLLAAGLAGGAAVTPTLQLRLQALDAVAQHSALVQQATPAVQQREANVKALEQLQAVLEEGGRPTPVLALLDTITRAMPDDTSLLSLQITAGSAAHKVTLSGQTGNAAALMQQLGNQPGLRDVRAPTPAVKPLGAVKESFTIEFSIDPPAPPAPGS